MKKKSIQKKGKNQPEPEARRSFVKKLGMGILVTSAYSLISLTQFGCKHEPLEPSNGGGY
jgi:hypothetical protein